jgi:hypothetical protein
MKTLSLRLPDEQAAALEAIAQADVGGVNPSAVRELLLGELALGAQAP